MLGKSLPISTSVTRLASCQASGLEDEAAMQEYAGYLAAVGSGIGELSPIEGEDTRGISETLGRTAAFLGLDARIWHDADKVYFFVRRDRLGGW